MSTSNITEYKEWYVNGPLKIHGFYKEIKKRNNTGQFDVEYNIKKRHGERKVWHINGVLNMHEFYIDGMLEGEHKLWDINGHLRTRTFYKNNERHGERKWWHDNGCLGRHEFYVNGKIEGERKVWHDNGTLICYWFYVDNVALDYKFTIFKKYKWINSLRKFRHKINLRKLNLLNNLMPFDLVKLCAKY